MSELTGSNHRCRAQFKNNNNNNDLLEKDDGTKNCIQNCAQTVVALRFAENGPNGLSYYTTNRVVFQV